MTDTTTHDAECENLPGGKYHGRTIGGGSDGFRIREPMPIPCHCLARAEGVAQAEREIAALARVQEKATTEHVRAINGAVLRARDELRFVLYRGAVQGDLTFAQREGLEQAKGTLSELATLVSQVSILLG